MQSKYITEFFDYLQNERRYSSNTISNYRRDIKQFFEFIGEHHGAEITKSVISSVTEDDVHSFLTKSMTQKQKSKSSLNRQLCSLRSFYKYLAQRQGIKNDAIALIKGLKQPAPAPKSITEADVFTLIQAFLPPKNPNWRQRRNFALMMLLYGVGLRISEALSLNRCDAHKNTLIIHGKGEKERAVPITAPVQKALQALDMALPDAGANAPLFTNQHLKRLTPRAVQQLLEKTRQEHDLPEHLTPHALRHSFASHLLANGTNLRSVQELLGHASLSTTQHYLDVDTERLLQVHGATHPLEQE